MLVMMIAALASGHAALTTHAVALHVADANCTWPMTCPGTLPLMNQTWQMNLSTIIMPCNNTGFTDPRTTQGWSIVDFDCTCGCARTVARLARTLTLSP